MSAFRFIQVHKSIIKSGDTINQQKIEILKRLITLIKEYQSLIKYY